MRLAPVCWSRKLQICQPKACHLYIYIYFGPTTYASTSTPPFDAFLPPQVPTPNPLNASACSLRKYWTHLHKEAKRQYKNGQSNKTILHSSYSNSSSYTTLESHVSKRAGVFRCRSSSILPFGSTKHLQNIHINHPLASRYWPATITTLSLGYLNLAQLQQSERVSGKLV